MRLAAAGTSQAAVPAAAPARWSFRFFIVWIVLLGAWELVVRAGLYTGLFLPAPSLIAASLAEMASSGMLMLHLSSTILRILLGLAGGAQAPAVELKAGDDAPAFSLPGSDGKTHSLADSKGKAAVVLAWFPKAFTGG